MTAANGGQSISSVQSIVTAVFHLIRNMVCWMALSPMIIIGGLLIFFSLAMMAVNFQDQAVTLSEFLYSLLDRYPLLQYFSVEFNDPDPEGGIDLGSAAFKQFLTEIYARFTLPIMILGTLMETIRGKAGHRASYTSKILKAGAVSLLLLAGWLLIYFFGSDADIRYSGNTLLLALILPGVFFVVSCFSLLISHAVGGLDFNDRELSYIGPQSRMVLLHWGSTG